MSVLAAFRRGMQAGFLLLILPRLRANCRRNAVELEPNTAEEERLVGQLVAGATEMRHRVEGASEADGDVTCGARMPDCHVCVALYSCLDPVIPVFFWDHGLKKFPLYCVQPLQLL